MGRVGAYNFQYLACRVKFPIWKLCYHTVMRIFSRRTLREFWEWPVYTDSEQSLKAWYDEASKASWQTPNEIKSKYKNASILKGGRVVFNIHGNAYRIVVKINYAFGVIYIRFVGTHEQYDKINADEV